MSLRETIELDLRTTLEGDFGLPVILVSPSGTSITKSIADGTVLMGQILYDTFVESLETGAQMVVHKPVVTLRRSALAAIPNPEFEKWGCKIPTTPSSTAATTTFIIERVAEDGGSIGFIRLYLTKAVQS